LKRQINYLATCPVRSGKSTEGMKLYLVSIDILSPSNRQVINSVCRLSIYLGALLHANNSSGSITANKILFKVNLILSVIYF
jgi:hypothetical protein